MNTQREPMLPAIQTPAGRGGVRVWVEIIKDKMICPIRVASAVKVTPALDCELLESILLLWLQELPLLHCRSVYSCGMTSRVDSIFCHMMNRGQLLRFSQSTPPSTVKKFMDLANCRRINVISHMAHPSNIKEIERMLTFFFSSFDPI